MRKHITVRLRERRDMDLIEAINRIEPGDLSALVRNGLRAVLPKCDIVTLQPETKKEPIVWRLPQG